MGDRNCGDFMTSAEVVLVMAGVPLAIMVLLGLLTLRPHFARTRRYRPGEEWNYPPVLWMAHRRNGAALRPAATTTVVHAEVPVATGNEQFRAQSVINSVEC